MKPLLVLPQRPGIYVLKTAASSSFVLDTITDTMIVVTADGQRSEPTLLSSIQNVATGHQAYIVAGGIWHLTAEVTRIEELPA